MEDPILIMGRSRKKNLKKKERNPRTVEERFLLDYVSAKTKPTINPFGRWKSHWLVRECRLQGSPSSGPRQELFPRDAMQHGSHTWNDVVSKQEDQACFHRYFPCHPLHAWVYNPRRGVPRYALSEQRSSSKFIRVARRARSLRQRTESFRALLFSLGFVTHRVHGTFIWRTRSQRHL